MRIEVFHPPREKPALGELEAVNGVLEPYRKHKEGSVLSTLPKVAHSVDDNDVRSKSDLFCFFSILTIILAATFRLRYQSA